MINMSEWREGDGGRPKDAGPAKTNILFLSRFAPGTTIEDVKALMSTYGATDKISVRDTFAFVDFQQIEDAEKAKYALHESNNLGSDRLVVDFKREKGPNDVPRRVGGYGGGRGGRDGYGSGRGDGYDREDRNFGARGLDYPPRSGYDDRGRNDAYSAPMRDDGYRRPNAYPPRFDDRPRLSAANGDNYSRPYQQPHYDRPPIDNSERRGSDDGRGRDMGRVEPPYSSTFGGGRDRGREFAGDGQPQEWSGRSYSQRPTEMAGGGRGGYSGYGGRGGGSDRRDRGADAFNDVRFDPRDSERDLQRDERVDRMGGGMSARPPQRY